MADKFYSVLKGDQFDPNTVTVGAGTSGEAIELRVVSGASISKLDILNALETLQAYFSKNDASIA